MPDLPELPPGLEWRHNDDEERWETGIWITAPHWASPEWRPIAWLTDEFLRDATDATDLLAAALIPPPKGPSMVTVTIQRSTLEAALNCLDALASDRREPERYRTWYAEAAIELRAGGEG